MPQPFSGQDIRDSWGLGTNTSSSTTAQQTLGEILNGGSKSNLEYPDWWPDWLRIPSDSSEDNRSDFDKVIDTLLGSTDEASKDTYYNWILNEKSLTDAYKRELEADSTKYQRLVQDLKKAGLNPMFALGGANAGNITSSAGSYSSGYETARHNKASEKNQREANMLNFIGKLISSAIGLAFAAL